MHPLLLALFLTLLSTDAAALVPPMKPAQLRANATLVVEGTVQNIVSHGESYEDSCYRWQNQRAELVVDRTHKGAPDPRVVLEYSWIVEDLRGCSGGRTSYALTEGARYKLYLTPVPEAKSSKGETVYGFINWAGVIKSPNGGSAPKSDGVGVLLSGGLGVLGYFPVAAVQAEFEWAPGSSVAIGVLGVYAEVYHSATVSAEVHQAFTGKGQGGLYGAAGVHGGYWTSTTSGVSISGAGPTLGLGGKIEAQSGFVFEAQLAVTGLLGAKFETGSVVFPVSMLKLHFGRRLRSR